MSSAGDPGAHLDPAFAEHFRSWAELRAYVAQRAAYPEYDERRALQQVLMADVISRLPGCDRDDWLLLGSLSLPARVPERWRWRPAYPDRPPIDQAYILPRTAFDLDLYAVAIAAERPTDATAAGELYGRRVHAALTEIVRTRSQDGIGLGGLVRYSADLRVYDSGQVMGVLRATPVKATRWHVQQVDDPISIEIDIKPPSKVIFVGEPQRPHRSVVGVDLPGFRPTRLPMVPTETLFADKACLLTGPPTTLRDTPAGPWHRYKDIFDLYFVTQAAPMTAHQLREALASNWNFTRMDRDTLPHPYRLYGDQSRPPDRYAAAEPAVDWRGGCERLRADNPQLRAYPDFDAMCDAVGACVHQLPAAAPDSSWDPQRGWIPTVAPGTDPEHDEIERLMGGSFPDPPRATDPGPSSSPRAKHHQSTRRERGTERS